MAFHTLTTLRAVRAWFTGRSHTDEREVVIDRGDREVPASIFTPEGGGRGLPGWVVLHGVTRPGRFHPTLLKFCRALATSGATVLVPQVPEWKNLRLAPEQTVPTIRAALRGLDEAPETGPGARGLIGFSFGCPQVLIAAADEEIGPKLGVVVGFGGYGDLESIVRFQMTGVHQWGGREHHMRPDPYGRWIIAANHLTSIPHHEDATDVARALSRLAVEAGERRILAWDPSYDSLKRKLRGTVDETRRELFDLFAPPSDREPDPERARELTPELAASALRASPLLDPVPFLPRVHPKPLLIHGKSDHLIPYTETMRLRAAFPNPEKVDTTITALFSHSEQEGRMASLRREISEGARLVGALRRMIASV